MKLKSVLTLLLSARAWGGIDQASPQSIDFPVERDFISQRGLGEYSDISNEFGGEALIFRGKPTGVQIA